MEDTHAHTALTQGPRRGSYLARLVLHVGHDALEAISRAVGVVGTSVVEVGDAGPLRANGLRGEDNVDGESGTAGALPAGAADPAGADLVEATGGVGGLVAGEENDEGCYVVGLEGLDHLLGHDGAGHGSSGVGGDGVDVDVVLGTLTGKGAGETKDTAFL